MHGIDAWGELRFSNEVAALSTRTVAAANSSVPAMMTATTVARQTKATRHRFYLSRFRKLVQSQRPTALPKSYTYNTTLVDLIQAKVLVPGMGVISVRGRESDIAAELTAEGNIVFNGITFNSPSMFVNAVLHSFLSGSSSWNFTMYLAAGSSTWRSLALIRNVFARRALLTATTPRSSLVNLPALTMIDTRQNLPALCNIQSEPYHKRKFQELYSPHSWPLPYVSGPSHLPGGGIAPISNASDSSAIKRIDLPQNMPCSSRPKLASPLLQLIEARVIAPGMGVLTVRGRESDIVAELSLDGTIVLYGFRFDSPSAFAQFVLGQAVVKGWYFTMYRSKGSKSWVSLEAIWEFYSEIHLEETKDSRSDLHVEQRKYNSFQNGAAMNSMNVPDSHGGVLAAQENYVGYNIQQLIDRTEASVAAVPSRTTRTNRVNLRQLIEANVISPGIGVIAARGQESETTADLTLEGEIFFKGIIFKSPSAFTEAAFYGHIGRPWYYTMYRAGALRPWHSLDDVLASRPDLFPAQAQTRAWPPKEVKLIVAQLSAIGAPVNDASIKTEQVVTGAQNKDDGVVGAKTEAAEEDATSVATDNDAKDDVIPCPAFSLTLVDWVFRSRVSLETKTLEDVKAMVDGIVSAAEAVISTRKQRQISQPVDPSLPTQSVADEEQESVGPAYASSSIPISAGQYTIRLASYVLRKLGHRLKLIEQFRSNVLTKTQPQIEHLVQSKMLRVSKFTPSWWTSQNDIELLLGQFNVGPVL